MQSRVFILEVVILLIDLHCPDVDRVVTIVEVSKTKEKWFRKQDTITLGSCT